jgi:hypothetical protein
MDNARPVARVNVEGRRVGDDGEALLGRLEGREQASLGCREADHPGVGVGRRKRQEEVRVDRQLRLFLSEVVHRALANRLARSARRRHFEAQTRHPEIDLRDAHVQWTRRTLHAIDEGDACIRVRDLRLAMESRSQEQCEDDAKPEEPSDAWAHSVRQFWIG